jgi:hypothetical protein
MTKFYPYDKVAVNELLWGMSFSLVQQSSAFNGAASLTLAVTTSALTAGNTLVAACAQNNTGSVSPSDARLSLSSGALANGSIVHALTGSGSNATPLFFFRGRILTGGATSVTFTVGTSGAIAAMILEFASTNPNVIDVSAMNYNGTSTAINSGTPATTASANELWIGATSFRNDTITSQLLNGAAPDNSYLAGPTTFGATTANRGLAMAYKIAAATAAPAYSATSNQVSQWAAGVMCLRELFTSSGGVVGLPACRMFNGF